MRALIAVLVVTAALAATPASSGLAAKLKGTVGPGYTIKLTTAAGKPVKTLKAGSYAITVSDRSAAHMFRLVGPGVNKAITSLGFRGTKTALVKLKAGKKYIYQCDPHTRDGMKASFTVTR